MQHSRSRILLVILLSTLGSTGCRKDAEQAAIPESHQQEEPVAEATNRVSTPDSVRRNLGITFARVERRAVAQTIRVPGSFEVQTNARREYRTMVSGRVELVAQLYSKVAAGEPLYRLASPEWRDLQEKLTDAESTIRQTESRVGSIPTLIAAHRRHEEILEKNIASWEERVTQLEQSHSIGAISAVELIAAQSTLSSQRVELAEVLEKEADLEGQIVAAQAEHDAAHLRFRLLIATASTVLSMTEAELVAPYTLEEHIHSGLHVHDDQPVRTNAAWRKINDIIVTATAPGIVEHIGLANGSWASTGSLVVSVADPSRLQFRARAMQSDLGRLRDGLPARIAPPKGGSISLQDSMEASLTIGLSSATQERTIELLAVPTQLAAWARPGVSAHLEIATEGGATELAIPMSCAIDDGLSRIIFRRDPKDPDKVIRMDADLGVHDGRWVVVRSGVREGDEVVLDGVYQLMIATSGTAQKGGHFHPDGSFHAGEDE